MKIKLLIIFLILFIHLYSVSSQDQVLGEVEISSTKFLIDASNIDTKINYLIDNTLSKPKLVITSLSGDAKDIDDIAKVSKDKTSIAFNDFTKDEVSLGSKISINGGIIHLFFGIIVVLSFGLKSKNNNNSHSSFNWLIVLVFGMVLFSNITSSLDLLKVSIQIDFKAPSTYKFDSLELSLGSGSSNIIGLVSNTLKVDACSNLKDHQVKMNQLSISSRLEVCSSKDISITSLQLASSNAQVNLNSTSNINLHFFNGYSGSIKVKSNQLNIDSGCNIKTVGTSSEGSCGTGGSNIVINSGSTTTISNVQITCPVESTWRPTTSSSESPISPLILTQQPKTDYLYDETNLTFMAQSLFSSTSLTDGPQGVSNSFTINLAPNAPNSNWLVGKTSTPSLKAFNQYEFSLSLKLGQALNKYNVISNMTLFFYNPNHITDPNASNQYFKYSPRDPIFSQLFTGDFSSSTDFKKISLIFTPTVDIGVSVMAVQVNRTTKNGSTATTVFIALETPTLLKKDSELVTIQKPPLELDPQDTSTCPYKDTDLVHWHDPSIWPNNLVPLPSSNIVLPEGKRALISPCSISQTDVYQKISIPKNSELVFTDSNITIHIHDILVLGKFTMGTKSCRYNSYINIIFHGSKTTEDTISQHYGSKGIAVEKGGFISIHGKQYHYTWTKLSATVWSDSVNWEVGQQVLITTSIFKDEVDNQNEVLTIAAIQGKTIQFTTPVKFYHYGGQEYQSEVALLSRRIVLNGDGDGSADNDSFGGHVLVVGEGQFAGIQLKKCGQTNLKARYPLHFHLAGIVKNSFISDCSVTNSYYRCYTIHGTSNLTLSNNVAFDARGHCYYLEDGVEVDNNLLFNLAAYVHPIGSPAQGRDQKGQNFKQSDELTQPADSAAGGFYITNASGGWAIYSFPNLPSPIGQFIDSPIIPQQYPIKEFKSNTAHSSGYFNPHTASIYVGGYLYYNRGDGLLYYSSGRYSRPTYINCSAVPGNEVSISISHWGERVEVNRYESHDTVRSASVFGEAWLNNAIINGRSGNIVAQGFDDEYTRQGFQFYDTNVKTILSNIVFRNYIHFPYAADPEEDNCVFIGMTHSDEFKPQFMSVIKNITIQGTATSQYIGHRIIDTGSSRHFNFLDSDGSVFSTPTKRTPKIIGSHESFWNFDNSCNFNSDWRVYVCDKDQYEISYIAPIIPGYIDTGLASAEVHVGNISLFGSGISDRRTMAVTKNPGITGIGKFGWYLYLPAGSPTYMKIWVGQVAFGQHIFFAMPYPSGTTFSVSCDFKGTKLYKNYTLGASAIDVRDSDGSKYYFDETHLFIKIVNFALDGSSDEYFERSGAKVYDTIKYYFIHITATNTITPPTKPINGFFTNLPDVLPSSTL
ncbi:hypothetical protein DICPUDRAFT_90740 [Dictyostelium purpureum]|uniref:G8 domain-containing protein n=1 Tax=Dictyostelium purpureum TaxID=5786 RepID=F1A4H0_DICPU|nr:uncharacterized protein DICPUDRAFT_90740 [Dictyostelium purpureum]EGC28910.1 hypothetical protein DICPUDRAFT_90740 [Dictyostelium purpureum]|eukprot:XP_003294565.1 hypothetical protein DICPUDRAFT_90740 [Dictyostelium purpureum]